MLRQSFLFLRSGFGCSEFLGVKFMGFGCLGSRFLGLGGWCFWSSLGFLGLGFLDSGFLLTCTLPLAASLTQKLLHAPSLTLSRTYCLCAVLCGYGRGGYHSYCWHGRLSSQFPAHARGSHAGVGQMRSHPHRLGLRRMRLN